MTKLNFGYSTANSRSISISDKLNSRLVQIFEDEPSLKSCIACGNCAAMCTAGNFTDFRFYKINILANRGLVNEIKQKANNCMLCGKCQLSCPRGVNIRHAMLLFSKV